MTQDIPVPPARAEQMIANLGPGVDVRTIDAGHTVMVSKPGELADIINEVVADCPIECAVPASGFRSSPPHIRV